MVEVSTSILSVEKEGCIQKFYDIECAGTNYFHIDVMDGKFVKNNTVKIMEEYTNYIKQISNTKIDVHLMVEDVEKFVKEYADMEVDSITFHIESVKDQKEVLNIIKYIKDKNIQVGLSIKPETENKEIYEYLPYIHKVLVMSVEPGEGGQKFIENTIEKVKNLSNYIEENKTEYIFYYHYSYKGGSVEQLELEVIGDNEAKKNNTESRVGETWILTRKDLS